MISIIDHFNNSIIFNSSFIITINNNIEIDYLNDNDWSEIYHHYTHIDNNNITPKRRRLWGWFKKRFKKVRQMLRKLFGKVAIPPPRSRVFWNKKWLKRGRYIGYFPGYANQKGLTYKKAEKYCDENFGGLATIFSKRENKIVFGICRSLLKKYKMKRKCKRKCKYILFRGTKCWNHCWIPKVEKLYIQKHWKGHNCWIGIRQGPSSKKSKAFHKWNDQRNVNYKNWSPNEPNYRTLKHCKKIYGSDGNNKQCDIEHIYDEKCGEILGYKAGHAKVSRSKKQSKLFKGIPVDIQQQIAPIGYARQTKYALVPRAGKWNNARCLSSRIPICQKPRGQVYDKYIAVRAARSQASAEQFCNNWYGSTLATIINDEDNIMAMEACNAIDIKKRSCWIGLARPFKKWNDGIKTKKFSNWAPNEPNNAGWNENCVEVYGGNGKWNDLACVAKRYFLCNLKTELQRMDSKIRKEMIMKRLRRHKDVWSRHRRKEYREKTRKQYGKRMARNKKMQKKMNAMNAWKQRDAFRQNMFNEQYGGFMKKLGINMNSFGGGNGLGRIMRGRRRFRRRVMDDNFEQDVQREIDLIHDLDDGYDEIPKGKLIELGMNMDDQQMLDTFGVGDYDDNDEFVNVKCKLFGGDYGLFEMCIDERGIDVKRYMYVNNESGSGGDGYYGNVSDVSGYYMGYMEYEDFKYKRVLRYENGSLNVGFNGDDDVDSYHLVLMEFVYDFDSNHNRQCWKYLYEFEICMVMELDGYYENGKMVMEIVKENNKIVFPSKMVRFYNDIEWNEINKLYDDKGENRMVVIKCIHMFDAKICIKCIYGMNEDELIPLSYIANVFLHDHYDVH